MAAKQGRTALLALLAGGATALAMPGLGLGPLSFISLVPLFWALEEGRGFARGFLFGLAFFGIDLRWILTLSRFTPLVILGYVLLCVYLAVYTGLFGLLVAWCRRRRGPLVAFLLFAPVVFASLELLRILGPLGFGFSDLYLSLYRFPALIQGAAFLGPFFLSAALVFTNAALYLAWRRRWTYLIAGAGMVGLLAAFSLLPIARDGERETVAVVSSEVSQESRLGGEREVDLVARYLALGSEAASAHPDLIVFPETILPNYILLDPGLLAQFSRLAQEAGASVLLGTGDVRDGELYNAVALLAKTGEVVGTYDKVHPVPFGEYIPARGLLEGVGLGELFDALLPVDLSPGAGFYPIGQLGTPICFETTFPSPARTLAARGATLLVTVTNDAWFVGSSELVEHFAAGVFRAVETRRYLVTSANGGISGIIDAQGQILKEEMGEKVTLGQVARRADRSVHSSWGAPLFYGLLALGGGAVLLSRRRG